MLVVNVREVEACGVKRMLLSVPGCKRKLQIPIGKAHARFLADANKAQNNGQ